MAALYLLENRGRERASRWVEKKAVEQKQTMKTQINGDRIEHPVQNNARRISYKRHSASSNRYTGDYFKMKPSRAPPG
ncbi:amine oxidase [Aspergillus luchuensis]|uniref:Amine oxidase n=1 Tax=Aspergillus kawachii TaxID=1069201 RepID=A0A146F780_ASPKA|nr:amine oxidase [Aspergillus luchuensis]